MPAVALADLIGQPEAAAFLAGVAARGRPANAYLLHGPAGVGKGTAAIAFARALLCERAAETGGDACGTCGACGKSAQLQHPDLRFLFPVSGEEKALDATVAETHEQWREDPFFVFTYDRAASIRLSMTRALLKELGYKPFEAGRRIVIVRDADLMREDQYSAMLKAIEEPGAATTWILTTARLGRLPATIRSRCQRVRFAALPESEIVRFLEERVGTSNREARMLAALGSGSLARALSLRDQEPLELRNQALALLEPALRGDEPGLWQAVQAANQFGRAGRERLRRMLEFQALWLRDLLRARYDAPKERLVNRDREAEIRRQAARVDASEIRRRLMVLEEALRAIDGNITVELALFSAMRRLAAAPRPEPTWPAHAAARSDY